MLTDRGKGLVATAGVLWLLSRLLGVPALSMAAVAALALVALAVGSTMLASASLTVRRSVQPARLFHDADGRVELRVTNRGRLPTATLQVEDRIPAALADGARFVLSPVRAGGGVTLRYRVHGRQRGRFDVGPLEVRLRDPFGIAARRHTFASTDRLTVYPPVWRLPAGLPLGGRAGSTGDGTPRPLRSGDELATIREYVRGDDLRKVHWASTAHRGKLMVRQDESPQNPRATVVLDVRLGVHRGAGPTSSLEAAVSATASAIYHVAERGYGSSLLTRPTARPGAGVRWEAALEELAAIGPDGAADLAGVWQQLATGAADASVLVAVVTVPDAVLLRQMVRAGRGFPLRVAVLVDAPSYSRAVRSDGGAVGTAAALRAAGWRVTLLAQGDRLDHRWRELISQTPTRIA
ncbi:MAG: DUF58 domain-containing protein [Actinomycetes bacterium]